ncbi:MAG: ABC transporter ATP-binding protein [Limnochordaceae bacterium]|nr:ABC transporter ATP-binding protein [Limnochordaceae bacterium]
MSKLLEVRDVSVSFFTYAGQVHAVRGISFDVNAGETLAVVGESGSGKSITALAIMGLIPEPGRLTGGHIYLDGQDITTFSEHQMQHIRGARVGMIFQDPMTSLNPTMTVGRQIAEGIQQHQGVGAKKAFDQAVEMLELVGIPQAAARARQYPYQFSGGQRQRVMIALALACRPALLIADEPTTALDVTIQAQILDLMKQLQERFGMAIILITHDLGVVARLADRVVVMYAGEIVESGSADALFYNPQHPYTRGLLRSVPNLTVNRQARLLSIPGAPPDLFRVPTGCPFAPRCPVALQVCERQTPPIYRVPETPDETESGTERSSGLQVAVRRAKSAGGAEVPWQPGEKLGDRGTVPVTTDHWSACWLLDERAAVVRQQIAQGGGSGGMRPGALGSPAADGVERQGRAMVAAGEGK